MNFKKLKLALALTATLLMWASVFVGIRSALGAYSPYHLALLRYLTASIILLGVQAVTGFRWPDARDLPQIFFLGLSGIAVYNLALNYGEINVTAVAASFIANTVPVITALLWRATTGWRLSASMRSVSRS
jgi:drug/metabolite transporter (DMT)-like permease